MRRREFILGVGEVSVLAVDSSHRKYVAAEFNAFLLAWLSAQSCPVLNRPTASCLSGPNWQPE
jgi:hypothetical protein